MENEKIQINNSILDAIKKWKKEKKSNAQRLSEKCKPGHPYWISNIESGKTTRISKDDAIILCSILFDIDKPEAEERIEDYLLFADDKFDSNMRPQNRSYKYKNPYIDINRELNVTCKELKSMLKESYDSGDVDMLLKYGSAIITLIELLKTDEGKEKFSLLLGNPIQKMNLPAVKALSSSASCMSQYQYKIEGLVEGSGFPTLSLDKKQYPL